MGTDFWGVVVPNWIAATGGLLGTALAVVSLVVALRARGAAETAVANDAETREAVSIVAKPPAVSGTASVTMPPLVAEGEGTVAPPAGEAAEYGPFRTSTDQEILDSLLDKWTENMKRSLSPKGKVIRNDNGPTR